MAIQDPQDKIKELEKKLNEYKEREKRQKKNKIIWLKRIGSWGSRSMLGGGLKQSIKTLVDEVADREKPISKEAISDVLGSAAVRITGFGCLGMLIGVIPILMLFTQTCLLGAQNKKIDQQTELIKHQNRRLDQQTYLQEAERRSSLVFLFSNVMDAVDKELKDDYLKDKIRNLSPQLIGRIIALSTRLRPYKYLEGDSLILNPLSPERGQLLVNLIESQLDTVTYAKLWESANFNNADLKGFALNEAYLVNIKLKGARLTNSRLRAVILNDADISGVDFSNAIIMDTKLVNTNLTEAILFNAEIEYSDLTEARLYGANLCGLKLSKTNLNVGDLTESKVCDLLFFENLAKDNIKYKFLIKKYKVDTVGSFNKNGIFFNVKKK